MGIYMINRDVLKYVPEAAYGFDDLMIDMLHDKREINVKRFTSYWLDIGRPDDYMQAIEEFDQLKVKLLHE